MGWLSWLWPKGEKTRRKPADSRHQLARSIRARYDAAATLTENERHWANADDLSAAAANRPDVRRTLRRRSRYECANNGYAQGLILTLANDIVGTGPTLQVKPDHAPGQDESDEAATADARALEDKWAEWCESVGFAEGLWGAVQSKKRDGEAVALLVTHEEPTTPVSLDVAWIECDRLSDPKSWNFNAIDSDGIEYTPGGRPKSYTVLRYHPGDNFLGWTMEADVYPAKQVIHWFRKDRPGQLRGVPEITASLPLFAQTRRWTLATLTSAETAADFAVMLESTLPADDETDEPVPFETLDIERGLMTTLPANMRANQMAAEHPNTLYSDFKIELLKEIGRPLNAPLNVVSGSSKEYNFSSGRLDYFLYRSATRVEREQCRRVVLEPAFAAWFAEASRIPGYLPERYAALDAPPAHCWYWPGLMPALNPSQDAAGDTEMLANGTTTLQELLAEHGQDWEAFVRQRARELKLMAKLGVPAPGAAPSSAAGPVPHASAEDEEKPEGEDAEGATEEEEAAGYARAGFRRNGQANGTATIAAPHRRTLTAYDDDQPRDEGGRWSSGGGGGGKGDEKGGDKGGPAERSGRGERGREGGSAKLPPVRQPKEIQFGDRAQAERRIETVLGRKVEPETIAAAALAPDGADVDVRHVSYPDRESLRVLVSSGEGYTAEVEISRHNKSGRLTAELKSVRALPASKHSGSLADEFVNGVSACKELGVDHIAGMASRMDDDKGKPLVNGYKVWPKMGFDADLTREHMGRLPKDVVSRLRETKGSGGWLGRAKEAVGLGPKHTLQDLYAVEGGKAAWEQHGTSINGGFSLKDGSRSMQVLGRLTERMSRRAK